MLVLGPPLDVDFQTRSTVFIMTIHCYDSIVRKELNIGTQELTRTDMISDKHT